MIVKIRDLLKKQKQAICDQYEHRCDLCPLAISWSRVCLSNLRLKDIRDFEKQLNKEISVDDTWWNYKY